MRCLLIILLLVGSVIAGDTEKYIERVDTVYQIDRVDTVYSEYVTIKLTKEQAKWFMDWLDEQMCRIDTLALPYWPNDITMCDSISIDSILARDNLGSWYYDTTSGWDLDTIYPESR